MLADTKGEEDYESKKAKKTHKLWLGKEETWNNSWEVYLEAQEWGEKGQPAA